MNTPPASEPAIPPAAQTACRACQESIHAQASVCRYCGARQRPGRWQGVGTILKWAGGITALASLLLSLHQVSGLLENWRERQAAVQELVSAAKLQADQGDYAGAWSVYEQAQQLEPGSRQVRDGQVGLAMQWLRDIRVTGNETFTGVVNKLLPVLYRGAAAKNPTQAADVLAHIGWANYLRYRDGQEGLDIEENFKRAEALDPHNPYAHAMRGFWILYQHGDAAAANREFDEALKSGRETGYVRELKIAALLNDDRVSSRVELARVANDTRKANGTLDADQQRRIFNFVYQPGAAGEFLRQAGTAIPASEHLATLQWLNRQGENAGALRVYKFYLAMLTEAAGDRAQALPVFQELDAESLEPALRTEVEAAIQRIGAAAPGRGN